MQTAVNQKTDALTQDVNERFKKLEARRRRALMMI